MASHYADLITYESFSIIMNTCTIEYSGVMLLKHMCGKKPGTKVDKIILNPKDGSWSLPSETKKKPLHAPIPKKPNMVEFKGVHTRFEDSEDKDASLDKEQSRDSGDELVYTPIQVESSTFKFFTGRNRVRKIDDDMFEEFSKYIHDLGSGSKDTIVINNADDLVRVAGVNLESHFILNLRYKLPSGNFSISRVF